MYCTAESRAFLAAIHEAGGKATMRDIRHRTDLSEGKRHHQFTKLEADGLIEIDRVEGLTTNGTRMKVAVLTEAAIDEIQRGVLNGNTDHSRRAAVDVAELAEQVEQIQRYISESVHPRFGELTELRRRIEAEENSA
jgi:DNA-binding MarR family transcriptional regulator